VLSVRSATEATVSHLEITIIAMKEETSAGQVRRLFFGSSGIFHGEVIPEGVTVNKYHYKEFLRPLRSSIRRKCPELWNKKN
jgi:hypothetical protein